MVYCQRGEGCAVQTICLLPADAEATNLPPVSETSWTSEYLAEERFEKYAAKFNGGLIAYGIKLSIDNGFAGDVVLEAKTTSLARHYEKDFGAVRLPTFHSSALRYLIADEAAKRIFFTYLV